MFFHPCTCSKGQELYVALNCLPSSHDHYTHRILVDSQAAKSVEGWDNLSREYARTNSVVFKHGESDLRQKPSGSKADSDKTFMTVARVDTGRTFPLNILYSEGDSDRSNSFDSLAIH